MGRHEENHYKSEALNQRMPGPQKVRQIG